MDATFRMRRFFRNLAIAVGLEFLVIGALGVYGVINDPRAKQQVAGAIVMGVLALAMPGLSLWMLVSYWRHELTVRATRVTLRGVTRQSEIDLRDVTEARWMVGPSGGSLVLRGGPARISIRFAHYEPEERARITEHIRSLLPPGVQSGWKLFVYNVAAQERRSVRKKPGPDEVLIRRTRWDCYLMATLPVTSVIGVIGWWTAGEWQFLVAGAIPPVLVWALMRSTTPAEGTIAKKLSATLTPASAGFLGFLLLWFLVAVAGIAAHAVFRPRLAHPDAFAIVGAAIWFGALMLEAVLEDLRRIRRDREAADLAAKPRGEAGANTWPID